MVKMLFIAVTLFLCLPHDLRAQDQGVIARLGSTWLLSKGKNPSCYSEVFKNYRIVIFARTEDCSTCLSKDSPWIQMIRSKNIPACFVFMSTSFRMAKYYYEINLLPFDFYCDTSRTAIRHIADKNTPVVLMLNSAGSLIFFDNPLSEMKRFTRVMNSVDSSGGREQ
jgi:hypothetical protein